MRTIKILVIDISTNKYFSYLIEKLNFLGLCIRPHDALMFDHFLN